MVDRVRLDTPQPPASAAERATAGGNYFAQPARDVSFFSSGCVLLDCALGGGWAEERVANLVGDKSSGKTLLAMEGAAGFAAKYPQGHLFYREREVAWDEGYARALGIPTNRLNLLDESEAFDTVEDFFEDVTRICESDLGPNAVPKYYILDSLDSLSDREELKRDIDKGSFGAAKAKQLSEFFRRLIRPMKLSRMTMLVISQVRDNIGVTFGEKHTRSGGKALDFYASQRLDLAQIEILRREITIEGAKVTRAIGIRVRGRIKKNKVGLPMREAEFPILFGYGVDEASACIDWLKATGGLGAENAMLGRMKENAFLKMISRGQGDHVRALDNLRAHVRRRWSVIETKFLPPRAKFGEVSNAQTTTTEDQSSASTEAGSNEETADNAGLGNTNGVASGSVAPNQHGPRTQRPPRSN